MSASLVGSEMCIRDRLRPEGVRRQVPLRGAGRFGDAARGRLRRRDARPVSYTHLTLPTICSV
eukprot:12021606-Alexandrium_andersonii.AAC.1